MAISGNFWMRLLQALLSLLLLYVFFFLVPHWHLLLFRIVMLMVALLASVELAALHIHRGNQTAINSPWRSLRQMPLAIIAGLLLPLICALLQLFLPLPYTTLALISIGCYIPFLLIAALHIPWRRSSPPPVSFLNRLFTPQAANRDAAFYLFLLFYPSLGVAIVILFSFEIAAFVVLPISLLMVAFYDSSSYIWGKLLGSRNRNLFAVSPHKSIAGLIGGTLTTIALSLPLLRSYPFIFGSSFILQIALIVAMVVFATLGDLFESAIKRVAQQKDSGNWVPGRGGVLDSIDSHLFAHPLFCALCFLLLRG